MSLREDFRRAVRLSGNARTGQYRFAVASGEFRETQNLMFEKTDLTLQRFGTDPGLAT